MTTTNISFDPALHAYKETDARHVLDLVLHHQLGTFSALEIAQVAELLPSWISRNIIAINNARADDTRDWYFPVFTRKVIPTHTQTSSSWSGIHHLVENQASATVHPLPPLPEVPPAWRVSTIVASAGGLLLLMPPIYPIPSPENVRPCRACGREGNQHVRDCWMNSNDWGKTKSRLRYAESKVPQDWKPLLVCNPLTKTWRELPVADLVAENGGPSKWRYNDLLIDMIVDEPANSYTIVMAFQSSFRMCIYTSTSNTWVYHSYKPRGRRELAWRSHICANAVVRGRLHYAFIEYRLDAPTLATLRVFEIKVETGEWKPWKEYALQVRVWGVLVARFIRRIPGRRVGREASEVLRYLALVECMGDLYVVIPTRLDEVIISTNNVTHVRAFVDAHRGLEDAGVEEMPVQFHILGLNCENNRIDVNGVLRIQVPADRSDMHLRRMSLLEKTSFVYFPYWNWFSCTARGSVIWVTCEDYLLRYDVVSGQSETQIIRKPRLVDAGVSYRPSFHMKP